MASKRISLILDFDGTITSQDTIGLLGDLGRQWQQGRGATVSPSWPQIVETYGQDYSQYSSSYQPAAEGRRSLAEELEYLRSLRVVEMRSLRRVESSGLFREMGPEAFAKAGRECVEDGRVVLREGFPNLMEEAARNAWHVSVLSVNWSASFIRGVLGEWALSAVIANEAQADGTIAGPDILGGRSEEALLTTCSDKARAMKALVQREGLDPEGVVYFGDSVSDTECLTENMGVVISPDTDSKLMRTFGRIGVDLPYVHHANSSDRLVWASTFKEVLDSRFLEKQRE